MKQAITLVDHMRTKIGNLMNSGGSVFQDTVFPREVDSRIVKASFRDCPLEDRLQFSKSKCILPISVGQGVHEGKKFQATMQLVNRSFKSCVILVDDLIQRHTMRIAGGSTNDFFAKSIYEGDLWLGRNELFFSFLEIPHKIIRWSRFLNHKDFNEKHQRVKALYESSREYKKAIDANIKSYLERYTKCHADLDIDYNRAVDCCRDYLFEECAGMCLWPEERCEFEVYASGRNQAMAATHKLIIQPESPRLLRSVALRFKKYPSKEELTFTGK